MDLLEKLFKTVSNQNRRRQIPDPQAIFLSEKQKQLKDFAQILIKKEIFMVVSRKNIGLLKNVLFLPEQNNFFADRRLNWEMYLYQILLSLASSRLEPFQFSRHNQQSRHVAYGRVKFIEIFPQVNQILDQELSGFENFQTGLLQNMRAQNPGSDLSEFIYAISKTRTNAEVANKIDLLKMFKKNEVLPDPVAKFIPELINFEGLEGFERDQYLEISRKTTELEKNSFEVSRNVSLEKEKKNDNPVMHSFEKIETLENYQGGYRSVSGDDELLEHAEALKELELDTVTQEGETSKSAYKSNLWVLFSKNSAAASPRHGTFRYPEWNEKEQIYDLDYCRLVEELPVENEGSSELDSENLRKVNAWKKILTSILNKPLWNKRLIEGSELDLDNVVREFTDEQGGHYNSLPKIYQQKQKSEQDLAFFFLFDQSMSTESYAKGQQVITVIQNSLQVIRHIFDDWERLIEISGFWSASRHQCHYEVYKSSTDSWAHFDKRFSKIEPKGYTRLGPAIRHCGMRFEKIKAAKKILFLITDGKPTDIDGYEGLRGMSDVKKSLAELKNQGIDACCFVIGCETNDYFKAMFTNYKIVSDPHLLCDQLVKEVGRLVKKRK